MAWNGDKSIDTEIAVYNYIEMPSLVGWLTAFSNNNNNRYVDKGIETNSGDTT